MDSKHEVYSKASDIIDEGWTQRRLEDWRGDVCLVGGLMKAADGRIVHTSRVDPQIIAEIAHRLRWYPTFQVAKLRARDSLNPTVLAIEFWNDTMWRRKSTVVKVLRDLAEDSKLEYAETERQRLSRKVVVLEQEITMLRTKITKLEKENTHLWNRLLNTRALERDQEILEGLEQEFVDNTKALQAL